MNLIAITRGHYNAGLEHISIYNLNHNVTWWQAIITTITDLIFHKTIEVDGAYVVYEIVKKRTIGSRLANVLSIYVPFEQRGQGVASQLLDMIPENVVISGRGKYEKVGELYVARKAV